MGGSRRRGLVRTLLPGAAIVVLMGSLFSYHREAARLAERALALEERAEARALRSRLLGTRVEGLELEPLRAAGAEVRGGGDALRVLWLVDPRSCVSCLDDLSAWRATARRPGVRAFVVLTGIPRAEALRVARSGLPDAGPVLWDPGAAGMAALSRSEPAPPFLLLVLGADGQVLAAEVGDRRSGCGPDLLENASALVQALSRPNGSGEAVPPAAVSSSSNADR